jgi:hypothetical protein
MVITATVAARCHRARQAPSTTSSRSALRRPGGGRLAWCASTLHGRKSRPGGWWPLGVDPDPRRVPSDKLVDRPSGRPSRPVRRRSSTWPSGRAPLGFAAASGHCSCPPTRRAWCSVLGRPLDAHAASARRPSSRVRRLLVDGAGVTARRCRADRPGRPIVLARQLGGARAAPVAGHGAIAWRRLRQAGPDVRRTAARRVGLGRIRGSRRGGGYPQRRVGAACPGLHGDRGARRTRRRAAGGTHPHLARPRRRDASEPRSAGACRACSCRRAPAVTALHWSGGVGHAICRPSSEWPGWPIVELIDRSDDEPWKRSLLTSPAGRGTSAIPSKRVVCVHQRHRSRPVCWRVARAGRCSAASTVRGGGCSSATTACSSVSRCGTTRPPVCQQCGSSVRWPT